MTAGQAATDASKNVGLRLRRRAT